MKRFSMLLAMVLAGLSAPALAQPEPRDEALELNRQAQEHYRAKEYQAAAEKFNAAYRLFPEPQILLGEALAWFRDESCGEAVPTASAYLKVKPNAAKIDRDDMGWVLAECGALEARSLVASGDLDAAKERLAESRRLDTGNKATAILEQVQSELDAAIEEQQRVAKAPPGPDEPVKVVKPAPEPREKGISTRTWIGGGLLGLSAVLAGTSIIFYSANIDEANAYNDGACMDCDPDKLRSNAVLNRGLYIGAGVLAGIGLGVLLWPEDEGQTTVSLDVSNGRPTFSLTTRF